MEFGAGTVHKTSSKSALSGSRLGDTGWCFAEGRNRICTRTFHFIGRCGERTACETSAYFRLLIVSFMASMQWKLYVANSRYCQ
jgi:hypothetical protein